MADAGSARKREEEEKEAEDDVVCLDPSFFVDRRTTFTLSRLGILPLRQCHSSTAGRQKAHVAHDQTNEGHMDALLLKEAEKHGMHVEEVDVTRTIISNLEGVIFDIILK